METNVKTYTRVVNGITQEVSGHSRGVGSGFNHSKIDDTPKRTPEQYEALRAKFAKHRLPRR